MAGTIKGIIMVVVVLLAIGAAILGVASFLVDLLPKLML